MDKEKCINCLYLVDAKEPVKYFCIQRKIEIDMDLAFCLWCPFYRSIKESKTNDN